MAWAAGPHGRARPGHTAYAVGRVAEPTRSAGCTVPTAPSGRCGDERACWDEREGALLLLAVVEAADGVEAVEQPPQLGDVLGGDGAGLDPVEQAAQPRHLVLDLRVRPPHGRRG